ncbi:MAG TPA: tannase/feruloyl esterase family alpha/beta hydrolase [Steroidobacteraceae bacterium]
MSLKVAAGTTFLCWSVICDVIASEQAPPVPSASASALEQRCLDLRSFALPPLRIDDVRSVPAGVPEAPTPVPPAAEVALPAHCLFRATLGPRTTPDGQQFGIGFELRLPLTWNGEFVFQGGGGLDGVLSPSYGAAGGAEPPALARGFAVVSTDGGHRSGSMIDAHFALDQQGRIDYAYNAVDKTTFLAKALIARFYGQAPRRSYFIGCSNGGRQAMIAAERLPLEFDGIVAGDPSFHLTRVNLDEAWNEIVAARAAPKDAQGRPLIGSLFSESDLQLVSKAVLEKCDALDGLADGMINDYRACRFDPAILTCKTAKSDSCLTPAQVTALKEVMQGPHDSQGRALYAPFPYDAGIGEPAFRRMHFGTSATAQINSADATLGFDSLRYYSMTPPEPGFDPMKFDFDRDPARLAETAKINDADAVYLNSFARHGKLILYHGLSDQGLSPLDTVAWYERAQSQNAGPNTDWARLFLVPGMTHCSGGPSTDHFDMLTAIDDWVEHGQAPERIVATGKAFPGQSRPLCSYPNVARYTGGDPSSEKSFACKK